MSNPPRSILRAIPSTALSRAAPTVPHASEAFEPLVKAILRTRQRSIYLSSAAFCWATTTIWMSWSNGARGALSVDALFITPFRPVTLLLAVAGWTVTAMPVLVLRKLSLATPPTPSASPSSALANARTKPWALRVLVAYAASAVAAMFLHLFMAYTVGAEDPRLGLFGRSKKYPLHLNGRFVYLLFSQVSLAGAYIARDALRDRLAVRWTSPSAVPAIPDILSLLPGILLPVSAFTFLVILLSTVVFGICRSVLLPIMLYIPVLGAMIRPFAGLFLRPRNGWTIWLPLRHTGLLGRTYLLSTATAATWEWATALFDEFVSAPITPSTSSASPTLALVSGAGSPHDYMRLTAFRELAELAMEDSPAAKAARATIFGDQKYTPNMWAVFVRESLLILGTDYQRLLARGKAPVTAAAAPPPAAPQPSTSRLPPATPLLKSQIFRDPTTQPRSPFKSLADNLSAQGDVARAVDDVATTGEHALPALFRSVRAGAVLEKSGLDSVVARVEDGKVRAKEVVQAVPTSAGEVKGLMGMAVERLETAVAQYIPRGAKETVTKVERWWSGERMHRVAETCLPRRELDARVVVALSYMVVASLEEDRYGVVQRDIPRILEALIMFMNAVQTYQAELALLHEALTPESVAAMTPEEFAERVRVNEEVERASKVVSVVGDALKDGISRIIRRFGERLSAFKFPPATATKLQNFVNFSG